MSPAASTCLMPREFHYRAWRRASRAETGGVTDSEDLARLSVSRAWAWRMTDFEDLVRPRMRRIGTWTSANCSVRK
jgi:hypothetical protein